MSYELRQYAFGETIGKGLNLYLENFIPIAFVSALCEIPIFFPRFIYLVPREYFYTNLTGPIIQAAFFAFASLFANGILSAFIVSLVANRFLENSALEIANPFVSFFANIFPTLGLSLLVGLLSITAGFACIIPGVFVSMGLIAAIPVYIVEKRSFFESMRRSWELTKGKRLEVFGLLFIVGIFSWGVYLLLSSIIESMLVGIPRFVLNSTIFALTSPIKSCIVVVIYFNLRIQKEGFNVEHLVQQFSLPDASKSVNS